MRYFFIVIFFSLMAYSVGLATFNDVEATIDLFYTDPRNYHIGTVLALSIFLSFCIGFIIGGAGWYSDNQRIKVLEKENGGLKGKLDKATKDYEFQVKKMSMIEDTMRAGPPPAPPKGKPPQKPAKKTFLGIPIG